MSPRRAAKAPEPPPPATEPSVVTLRDLAWRWACDWCGTPCHLTAAFLDHRVCSRCWKAAGEPMAATVPSITTVSRAELEARARRRAAA